MMSNQQQNQTDTKKSSAAPVKRPNEHGSIVVQAHVKIFDPQTKKVFVEGRA